VIKDPDYKLSLQVANWQREDLEEQYPLCEECSSKVEKALKEKNVPAIKRGVEDEEDDSWLDLMPEPEPIKLAQKPSFSFTVLSRVKGILWHLTHLSSLLMYSLGKCGTTMRGSGQPLPNMSGIYSTMETICSQRVFNKSRQISFLSSIPLFKGYGMGLLAILDGDVPGIFILDGLGTTHSSMVWSRPGAASQS
jgi:hypothetical protein